MSRNTKVAVVSVLGVHRLNMILLGAVVNISYNYRYYYRYCPPGSW